MDQQRSAEEKTDREQDLIDAFAAMGGSQEKRTTVNLDRLRKVLRDDFGMTLDLGDGKDEKKISHELDYDQFKSLFT